MKAFYTSIIFFILAVSSMAEAPDIRVMISQKADWPKEVMLVKNVKSEIFSAKGKKLGEQALQKGRKFTLHGIYIQGVAVKLGSMIAFVAPESTDVAQRIENEKLLKDLTLERPRPDR